MHKEDDTEPGSRKSPTAQLPPPTASTSVAKEDLDTPSDDDGSAVDYLDKVPHGFEDHDVSAAHGSWTQEEENTIIRKFDRRLVIFMALLYMLSFLDRSNIGNARIAGMEDALHLNSDQYDWLLTAFYITYIVFEWMTLMYKIVPPHIYISLCVFSWGLLASLQSVAGSFRSMLIIRALLGVSEAAFGPGVPFYLSFFYKKSELAYRVGLFIAAAPLATSFASTLAWIIVRLSRNGPLAPWRALFLVEGFPSIVVAILAFCWIPDSPSEATYLTPRECWIATRRLTSDTAASASTSTSSSAATKHAGYNDHRISLRDILHTLLDPPAYLTALMFLSCNVSFSSLPVFLPTIIHGMGFTSLRSQILSAPPYLVSFIFVLLTSSLSDRFRTRSGLLIPVALLSSLSYLTIALAGHFHATLGPTATLLIRYLSVYGAAMGFFASITLIITWTLNNQHTHTGRGTGMAILNIIGQTGPLIGVRLYPDEDAPYYVSGMVVCAAFMIGVAILAVLLRVVLGRRNHKMDIARGGGVAGVHHYEEVEMEERGQMMGHNNDGGDDEEHGDEGDDVQRGLMRDDDIDTTLRRSTRTQDERGYRYIL